MKCESCQTKLPDYFDFYWVKFSPGDDWVVASYSRMDGLFRGFVAECPLSCVRERMEEIGPQINVPTGE